MTPTPIQTKQCPRCNEVIAARFDNTFALLCKLHEDQHKRQDMFAIVKPVALNETFTVEDIAFLKELKNQLMTFTERQREIAKRSLTEVLYQKGVYEKQLLQAQNEVKLYTRDVETWQQEAAEIQAFINRLTNESPEESPDEF